MADRQAADDLADIPDDLPQSHSFNIYRCGTCPNLHLVLRDEDGAPFAEMVISNDQAIEIGGFGRQGNAQVN